MIWKFPGRVSGKYAENYWISEMRTIQTKILEIPGVKSTGTEIPDKKFSKVWAYLARLSSFTEIPENAISDSPLEIFRNFRRIENAQNQRSLTRSRFRIIRIIHHYWIITDSSIWNQKSAVHLIYLSLEYLIKFFVHNIRKLQIRGPLLKEYIYLVVPSAGHWIYKTGNNWYRFVWSTQLGARLA